MELKDVQRHWDAFGRTDPLWAIVTRPDKRHGQWKYDEFFALGEEEIDRVLRHVAALSFPLRRKRALDFGCGAGRLTQALGRHFQQCDGVDIAPSMIELAREYDRAWRRLKYEMGRARRALSRRGRWRDCWPGLARLLKGKKCRYLLNESSDLTLFERDSFDLVYSSLVLQHMKPEYSREYIKEFLRVLAPRGLIVFQIPGQPRGEHDVLPYQAGIHVDVDSLALKPGACLTLSVRVTNLSELTWPAVNLGNHWLSENGAMVVPDDGRAFLPPAMKPRQSTKVNITVTAPSRPGRYWLELDIVQEFVLWFDAMGSPTTRIRCEVQAPEAEGSAISAKLKHCIRGIRLHHAKAQLYRKLFRRRRREPQPPDPEFETVMETYGVSKEETVKWIEGHGGRIIDIQTEISAGKDWESFRYYVTKG